MQVEITRLHDEIERKNEQISLLGHISDSDTSSCHKMDEVEQSRVSDTTFYICVYILPSH